MTKKRCCENCARYDTKPQKPWPGTGYCDLKSPSTCVAAMVPDRPCIVISPGFDDAIAKLRVPPDFWCTRFAPIPNDGRTTYKCISLTDGHYYGLNGVSDREKDLIRKAVRYMNESAWPRRLLYGRTFEVPKGTITPNSFIMRIQGNFKDRYGEWAAYTKRVLVTNPKIMPMYEVED